MIGSEFPPRGVSLARPRSTRPVLPPAVCFQCCFCFFQVPRFLVQASKICSPLSKFSVLNSPPTHHHTQLRVFLGIIGSAVVVRSSCARGPVRVFFLALGIAATPSGDRLPLAFLPPGRLLHDATCWDIRWWTPDIRSPHIPFSVCDAPQPPLTSISPPR
ncbi:uncharacterized protein BJX67DRAFT_290923 [Aspergillus lucknowensis]|uniref:Uncharacterized protein n=1 Tax=Aspergillus lucknowensis TaxID=176173 RepID=A0ABR4LDX9_9EURO